MSQVGQQEDLPEEYYSAHEQFLLLAGQLEGETIRKMQHGEIEAFVSKEGNEVLRLLLQAHLDRRCNQEVRKESVCASDGTLLTHCRCGCERDLMTIFGKVTVRRKGYSAKGVPSLFPMDGELNLPEDKYSHSLRFRAAEEVASHSFDEAVSNIGKNTGGKVPKRQIEEVSVRAARDFDEFYSARKTEGPEPTSDILVMSVDQKGIVMRKDDLREETRKAAEKKENSPGVRLAPGEKLNRKRMATVAAVYTLKARERSPEMIMGLCPDEDKANRPRCENKRVWASLEHDPDEVIRDMFEEAQRRDPEKKRTWVGLLDGGEKQLDIVLSLILSLYPAVILVLDFIHVLEYVWKAAYSFHAVSSKEAEDWVAEWALRIFRGEAAQMVRGLRKDIEFHKLTSKKREAVEKCANYLEKYDVLLDYPYFLKLGLPIATGVIEGACRHLIKDRMDLTGARWRLQRAEAVLRIRSLRSSGDLDAYWMFHKKREQERNHGHAVACAA